MQTKKPRLFKVHVPTRGSCEGVITISRVEWGPIRGVSHITGRVGSGQKIFRSHGSGRVTLTRSDP